MSKPDQETLDALVVKHHDVALLSHLDEYAVVKLPNDGEVDSFYAAFSDPARRHIAFRRLFNDTVVWPPAAELAAIMKKRPALAIKMGERASEFFGMAGDATMEKVGP